MQDPIIETKTCRHCQSSFEITQGDMNFYAKISPTFAGKKFSIPNPTLCPDCRQRRRLAFRNERNLYRRTCDASGKQIISIYSPDKPYKVYDQKIRRSDAWDPMDYGREFNFSKTFTQNFDELIIQVPRLATNIYNSENCEYNNYIQYCKNCYMTVSWSNNQDSFYTRNIRRSTYCFDCLQIVECEECYNIVIGANNYKTYTAYHVFNCSDSAYLYYCDGCKNCILCHDLINQEYCINNEQLTPEEYETRKNWFTHNELNLLYNHMITQFKHTQKNYLNNDWLISWNFIRNSSNIKESYNISSCKSCSYCYELEHSEDCQDCFVWGLNNVLTYDASWVWNNSFQNAFLIIATDDQHCYYSDTCITSTHLYGCIGLHNKQYCIFNKQYTKDDYEKTVAKIIAHMQETGERGEFFHPRLSPFGYNETVAQDYYELQKIAESSEGPEIRDIKNSEHSVNFWKFWYKRSTYESPRPVSEKVIQGKDLPETIEEVEDSILQNAIACEVTGKLFRIQPQELAFYRKHNIPLPRKHPDVRHLERLALRK